MTKMTKKVALEIAISAIGDSNDEAVEKLRGMIAQLEKKSSGERKPTATQKENVKVKEAFAEFLADGEPHTATEIGKACGDLSNQKASALLKQMVDEGTVEKFSEKRKTFFKIAQSIKRVCGNPLKPQPYGYVTQLVEQQTLNLKVVGSSPTIPTNY